jgi:hypothetical protein
MSNSDLKRRLKKPISFLVLIITSFVFFLNVPYAHGQPINFTLDFKEGNLRGWERTGDAFKYQPTLGDNPTARNRGQPSNHQGRYWIGTYEKYQGLRGQEPGDIQGDEPQGTLTSAPFTIPRGTLSFLVGGGSSFETRVELLVQEPIEGSIRVFYVSGRNTETMHRVEWNLTPYAGKIGKIRIVDTSSGPWGHINADDFRFSSAPHFETPATPVLPRDQKVEVPDLVRRNISEAESILREFRLQLGDITKRASDNKEGTILRQEPSAGTRVPVGSPVNLWISSKREKPVARINPAHLRVVQGEKADFGSQSTPEGGIRESWTGPGGQKATGNSFKVYTDQLNPDSYVITLKVIDRWEQVDRATATLEVIPKPIGKYNVTIQADPTSIEEGKSVRLEAALHPPIQNVQYRFNFGDQWSDWTVESEIQHTFSSPGIYHAFVRVRKEGKIIAESRPVDIEIYRVHLPPGDGARRESVPGTDRRPGIPPWLKWAGIIAGLGAVFGAGYYLSRKAHNQKKEKPSEPSIHIRPYKDIGTQQIESETPVLSGFEICLRPVLDKGKQDIEANGSLIDERREHG